MFSRYFLFKGTQGKKTPVKRLINSQPFCDNPITPGGLPVIQNLTKFGQMSICDMVMTKFIRVSPLIIAKRKKMFVH